MEEANASNNIWVIQIGPEGGVHTGTCIHVCVHVCVCLEQKTKLSGQGWIREELGKGADGNT